MTNPNGKTTRSTYDALGRVTQVTTPQGFITQYILDANNNVTGIIDANAQAGLQPKNANGHSVTRQYDQLDRLIMETDAVNGITRYTYDLAGNLTGIFDASGKITTNVYDGLGRLTTVIDPLIETPVDKVVSYSYDEAGNVLTKTDRLGKVTRTTYDALNRPFLGEYLADGTNETTVYDIYGNRYSVTNGAVTYSYTYDLKNRMLSKTDNRLNKTISYTYDKAGNIQTKTDYQNDTTTYEYDASNRLVAETNPAYLSMSYQYDGAGRLLARILSNGASTSYGWDDDDRLISLTSVSAGGSPLSDTRYGRDRVGNLVNIIDVDGIIPYPFDPMCRLGLTSYTYDALYRLATANYPTTPCNTAYNESFSYDAAGNRLTHTKGGAVHAYEYVPGSNRLKAIHTTTLAGAIEKSFTYNDEGQLIAQTGAGAKTLAWDQKGRPTAITPVGFTSNTFGYDPMDRRIARSDSKGNQSELLEGDHLEAIYSGTTLLAKYMRGAVIDEVVNGYQYDTLGTWTNYTYHHDLLQSVLGLSGHQGTVLTSQSYTAFGESRAFTGASNSVLKYTGRELDSDSGLYQYRARYYDPGIGRFVSEDPKGFGAGVNFYTYVQNNPVNANDPSGLELVAVPLPGTGNVTQNFLFDSKIAPSMTAFVRDVRDSGIPVTVNLAFRTTAEQTVLYNNRVNNPNPVAPPGTSRHESGFAIDLNGISKLSASDNVLVNQIASEYGLSPIANDPPHFQANPVDYGYSSKSNAIQGNQFDYQLHAATDFVSLPYSVARDFDAGSAAGGFLLYPNKPNTNQVQRVYSK